ncbi:hypothetical protein Smp_146830 [Schistosoma mansoni]|uniref:hypothetical protein n=1 Tax=Schistosoma mansoni TaxID=6183 RepID=UPI0001A63928|nr:hypothetical protein Smp_146830 [Schistosoma mansoni]|eukprot:XP_018654996.1 hypothetical protein Smp_146830 [Schistosoma mansoni]
MNDFQKLLLIFGGFISYMLADGYTYSMGILYSELMSDFHLSSVEAAILPGMIFSMPQFFAPFLCPLLDTYGFSSGSAWGALLMWIGCFDAELNAKTLVKHEVSCPNDYPLLSSHSNIIKTNAENSDYDIVSKERINGMRFSNRSLSFGCPQFLQEFTSNFKRLFSPKLWKNPNFLFYVIANGIAGAGVVIPWTFVYDHVLTTLYYLNDQNSIGDINNQDISWLPSLIGFGLLFGQLFYGLITSQFGDIGTCFKNNNQDSKVENGSTCCQRNCFQSINKKCPSSKYQFHLAIFLITLLLNSACTLTLALVPLWSVQSESKHFELFSHQEGKLLALACFFVGISNGGLYVMFPQLIIDIVGTELWSSGLGLFLTFNGLMNLCGTNIGGKIYDTRGSYQMALLIAAFLSLFAFLLVVMKEIFTWLMKRSTLSANSD